MKLLGSIKELVKLVFRTSGGKEVEVQPAEQTAAGPVTIEIPDVGAGGSDTVVMEATSATLSNKTIDNSNNIDAEAIADGSVTNAEFQYLGGVTSDIQTQIDGKEDTITLLPVSKGGTNSSTALGNDKVMVSGSDAIVESTVTTTELGHLSGVSSNIQDQIDNKADAGANSDITSLSGLTTALSISQGGTGETTANDALNAFLPSQSGNLNKFLRTDGTDVEWAPAGGGSGINYMSEFFDSDVSPVTTSVAAIDTTNTDYTNFLVSSAGGTLSQDTASSLRGANSYKFVPTASGEFFAFPAFQLSSVDLGKAISIKFDLKNDGAAADYDVVVCRYNSSGVHQEIISVAGTASAGTPASAQLPTSLTSFRGFFITNSSSTDYYRLFVRHLTSATDAVYLDTLVIGPDAVMEGAIVTDWVDGGPITITGVTTNPTKGTVIQDKWWYRRVGDTYEFRMEYGQSTAGTGGSGQYLFTLPAGLSIDTNKIQSMSTIDPGVLGSATIRANANYWSGNVVASSTAGTTSQVRIFYSAAGASATAIGSGTTASLASTPIRYYAEFRAPIAGAVANTQQAARAVEEYAANTCAEGVTIGTTYSNTSFVVNGPTGGKFPNVGSQDTSTGSTRYIVQWQTAHLATDTIILEMKDPGTANWYPTSILPFIRQSVCQFGVSYTPISSTQGYVNFGRAGSTAAGTYGNTGNSWSNYYNATDSLSYYWRVRKVSGGAAVGFPVSARNIIGDTSGTAVPAGYVGENSTTQNTAGTALAPGGATLASVTLTAGVWLLTGTVTITATSGDTVACYWNGFASTYADISRTGVASNGFAAISVRPRIVTTATTVTASLVGQNSTATRGTGYCTVAAIRIA